MHNAVDCRRVASASRTPPVIGCHVAPRHATHGKEAGLPVVDRGAPAALAPRDVRRGVAFASFGHNVAGIAPLSAPMMIRL